MTQETKFDPTKPCQQKNGSKAIYLGRCDASKKDYPLWFALQDVDNEDQWGIWRYTEGGNFYGDGGKDSRNLINIPEEEQGNTKKITKIKLNNLIKVTAKEGHHILINKNKIMAIVGAKNTRIHVDDVYFGVKESLEEIEQKIAALEEEQQNQSQVFIDHPYIDWGVEEDIKRIVALLNQKTLEPKPEQKKEPHCCACNLQVHYGIKYPDGSHRYFICTNQAGIYQGKYKENKEQEQPKILKVGKKYFTKNGKTMKSIVKYYDDAVDFPFCSDDKEWYSINGKNGYGEGISNKDLDLSTEHD